MVQGVLDGLEAQIVNGSGTGEDMLGLLKEPGTTTVPFNTDPITTLRSAVTALQVLGEVPNGWALNPVDAQAVDLERWGTAGGFVTEGYATGVTPGADPSSNNIFGADVRRVVSNSVPVGTAILGDFTRLKIYVRQDAHMDVDASGPLFATNEFVARGEGRYGIGILRPSRVRGHRPDHDHHHGHGQEIADFPELHSLATRDGSGLRQKRGGLELPPTPPASAA